MNAAIVYISFDCYCHRQSNSDMFIELLIDQIIYVCITSPCRICTHNAIHSPTECTNWPWHTCDYYHCWLSPCCRTYSEEKWNHNWTNSTFHTFFPPSLNGLIQFVCTVCWCARSFHLKWHKLTANTVSDTMDGYYFGSVGCDMHYIMLSAQRAAYSIYVSISYRCANRRSSHYEVTMDGRYWYSYCTHQTYFHLFKWCVYRWGTWEASEE